MEDKKRIFCSKCGKKLYESDKFCPNCGKGENNKNKKLIFTGVIIVAIVLVTLGSLVINELYSSTEFNGVSFKIPKGYNVDTENSTEELLVINNNVVNGTVFIFYSANSVSFEEGRKNLETHPGYIVVDKQIGKYQGYEFFDYINTKTLFVFQKDNKTFAITGSSYAVVEDFLGKV